MSASLWWQKTYEKGQKTSWLMAGKWWELGRDPHRAGGSRLTSSRWAESCGGVMPSPA
jgi:hypothetical protein